MIGLVGLAVVFLILLVPALLIMSVVEAEWQRHVQRLRDRARGGKR